MHPVTTDAAPEQDRWDLVIEPHGHVRELWHYRDLIALFMRRDFVA